MPADLADCEPFAVLQVLVARSRCDVVQQPALGLGEPELHPLVEGRQAVERLANSGVAHRLGNGHGTLEQVSLDVTTALASG